MQSRTRHYLKATLGLKSPFVSEPSEQLQLLLFSYILFISGLSQAYSSGDNMKALFLLSALLGFHDVVLITADNPGFPFANCVAVK